MEKVLKFSLIEFHTLGPLNLMLSIPEFVLSLGKDKNIFEAVRILQLSFIDFCEENIKNRW